MKKRGLNILFLGLILAFFACNNTNKTRLIPYDTFKNMLVEMVFMDSYAKMELIKLNMDTVAIYKPIFDKYNYSVEDVRYTLEEFASRKSNVVVVLIEDAIAELEKTNKVAQFRAELDKKWIEKGRDEAKEIMYINNENRFLNSLDSTELEKFVIKIPLEKKGDYEIKFRYMVDSLDKNNIRYLDFQRVDSINNVKGKRRSMWMSYKVGSYKTMTDKTTIDVIEEGENQIEYNLSYFGNRITNLTQPFVHYDSIEVAFYPLKNEARKFLFDKYTGVLPIIKLKDSVERKYDSDLSRINTEKWLKIDTTFSYESALAVDTLIDSMKFSPTWQRVDTNLIYNLIYQLDSIENGIKEIKNAKKGEYKWQRVDTAFVYSMLEQIDRVVDENNRFVFPSQWKGEDTTYIYNLVEQLDSIVVDIKDRRKEADKSKKKDEKILIDVDTTYLYDLVKERCRDLDEAKRVKIQNYWMGVDTTSSTYNLLIERKLNRYEKNSITLFDKWGGVDSTTIGNSKR
ncbi:MAG: hypothetical protein R3Y50_01830 [Rikenellaceae bacterium]